MAAQLSENQKVILSRLEQFEKQIQFESISEMYMSASKLDSKKASEQEPRHQQSPGGGDPVALPILTLEQMPHEHSQLHSKLKQYKAKSELVRNVGELIHQYDHSFGSLIQQRADLLKLIGAIHKDTSDLISKQKKYIDLSNSIKEALDYYALLDRFQFNYVAEPAGRDMFEDQIQPVLSELVDGIEFFTVNTNYCSSKKYLNGLLAAKTKMTSFIKSFLIKLFNKEYGFSIKYTNKIQIGKFIDTFYPKSKPKFLVEFVTCFPQFAREVRPIMLGAKESCNEQEAAEITQREAEIEEFALNDRTLSLVAYLQKSLPDVYEQVVLKFLSYYRTSFHENLHKVIEAGMPQGEGSKFEDSFREVFTQSIFIISCEAAYLQYYFKPFTEASREYTQTTLLKISQFYAQMLVRLVREPGKNKNPFSICHQVSFLMLECHKFLKNYTSRQYESYVLGAVVRHLQEFSLDIIRTIYEKIGNKIKLQMENACQNMLPRFKQSADKAKVTQDIREFVKIIPDLKYCSSHAEKYLISSLDTLVKSIKEVSSHIESRFECYAWNIEIFAYIDESLASSTYSLVKRETKLDVGETAQMFERVRNVQRGENLLKYASDLFTVIRAGVPSLAELTLDFSAFIKEYYRELREKFLKDMVFVHAKNIIEFIQSLQELDQGKASKLCQTSTLKNLQSGYKLSIENFIAQAQQIRQLRGREFAMFDRGQEILDSLIGEVEETLLDLMGNFYVEASKYTPETENFENIVELRASIKENLLKKKSSRQEKESEKAAS